MNIHTLLCLLSQNGLCNHPKGSYVWFQFKGQIKAKNIFIDFDHLRPGDFKISN